MFGGQTQRIRVGAVVWRMETENVNLKKFALHGAITVTERAGGVMAWKSDDAMATNQFPCSSDTTGYWFGNNTMNLQSGNVVPSSVVYWVATRV